MNDREQMFDRWLLERGHFINRNIKLITLQNLLFLKKNKPWQMLICIDGNLVPAKDCNEDTRFGLVAYGYIT
jgi:hypothetical protein